MSEENFAKRSLWSLDFVGQGSMHSFYLYHIISATMYGDRSKLIKGIIELGTGNGVLTTYLSLWAMYLRIPVYSYDINNYPEDHGYDHVLRKLGVIYRKKNIFESIDEIKKLISSIGPIYLVCDNGDKAREFNTFVPCLHHGSIVSAHDWPTQITYEAVKDTITSCNLQPINEEMWLMHGSTFATWLKP